MSETSGEPCEIEMIVRKPIKSEHTLDEVQEFEITQEIERTPLK